MHTPAAALTWELWRKHRTRIMIIVGLVLGFALLYPKLCALVDFNPDSSNAEDELGNKFIVQSGSDPLPLRMVRYLYLLFLACGPTLAMFLTLLSVAWMFIFCELDSKTKDPLRFPARLFTLPVSTHFLFWYLWLGGMVAVAMLYGSWVYFVRLPHFGASDVYHNCFGWMTLLALAQGIVWALAAWPITRALLLMVALLGFLFSPALSDTFKSPVLFPALFVPGFVLSRVGLQKMRHGQWQQWIWKWPFETMSGHAALRGPKRFASPAQAQLWFEWRRFARGLCLITAALAVLPVLLHLLLRIAAGLGPLSEGTMLGFAGFLVFVPPLVPFFVMVNPARLDAPFPLMRPLTNGQIMMATLKAAAVSAIVAWLIVLATFAVLPLLGDFHTVAKSVSIRPQYLTLIVPGLILLTWRLTAVNLGFVWSGHRHLASLPVLLMVYLWAAAIALSFLSRDVTFWNPFYRLVPGLLASLIVVKFLLASLAFRLALRRRLLAPSAVAGYLAVWTLLAATLLIPAAILLRGTPWILRSLLGIVLLIPLARIGFCPIALNWKRHT